MTEQRVLMIHGKLRTVTLSPEMAGKTDAEVIEAIEWCVDSDELKGAGTRCPGMENL